ERALAQLLRAVAATTFRPLLLAVAAISAHGAPRVHRPSRPAITTPTARRLLLAHSLGRRGPPRSVTFA
ncbi:hypothetical protein N4P33_28005, partial [Streptomyces sp. 15-116A]|nr:hypothetical protein [Streptomyces sp. 15-116A]